MDSSFSSHFITPSPPLPLSNTNVYIQPYPTTIATSTPSTIPSTTTTREINMMQLDSVPVTMDDIPMTLLMDTDITDNDDVPMTMDDPNFVHHLNILDDPMATDTDGLLVDVDSDQDTFMNQDIPSEVILPTTSTDVVPSFPTSFTTHISLPSVSVDASTPSFQPPVVTSQISIHSNQSNSSSPIESSLSTHHTNNDISDVVSSNSFSTSDNPLPHDDVHNDSLLNPVDTHNDNNISSSSPSSALETNEHVVDNIPNVYDNTSITHEENNDPSDHILSHNNNDDRDKDGENDGICSKEDSIADVYATLTYNDITYALFKATTTTNSSNQSDDISPPILFNSSLDIKAIGEGTINDFIRRLKAFFELMTMDVSLVFRNLDKVCIHEETDIACSNGLTSFWYLYAELNPNGPDPLDIQLIVEGESAKVKLDALLTRAQELRDADINNKNNNNADDADVDEESWPEDDSELVNTEENRANHVNIDIKEDVVGVESTVIPTVNEDPLPETLGSHVVNLPITSVDDLKSISAQGTCVLEEISTQFEKEVTNSLSPVVPYTLPTPIESSEELSYLERTEIVESPKESAINQQYIEGKEMEAPDEKEIATNIEMTKTWGETEEDVGASQKQMEPIVSSDIVISSIVNNKDEDDEIIDTSINPISSVATLDDILLDWETTDTNSFMGEVIEMKDNEVEMGTFMTASSIDLITNNGNNNNNNNNTIVALPSPAPTVDSTPIISTTTTATTTTIHEESTRTLLDIESEPIMSEDNTTVYRNMDENNKNLVIIHGISIVDNNTKTGDDDEQLSTRSNTSPSFKRSLDHMNQLDLEEMESNDEITKRARISTSIQPQ